MTVYIDRKYLLLVSSKLERFSEKNADLFNFRCPICGDSKKNKLKARGFVYRKENDYYYRCHNCEFSTTFGKFLKLIDEPMHQQYVLERYVDSGKIPKSKKPVAIMNLVGPKPVDIIGKKTIFNLDLPNIKDLEENNPARKYIEQRLIPQKHWGEIFYAEDFKGFMDTTFPDHGKLLHHNDPRIVLCYTNLKGEITNISGRSISGSSVRYITVKVSEEKKIFGTHRVDLNKTVYVVEGQFDSFFLDNAVACGDSNLIRSVSDLKLKDFVLVFDNEPRNREINKLIAKAIEMDYPVALFPERITEKDINEMVLAGMTPLQIEKIINDNTYAGLSARLRHSVWRHI